jgi:hypothetical protein
MFTTFHRGLSTAVLILLLFAVFPALTLANHSWGNYHWARKSTSFTLKLGDNVSTTWDSYLATTSWDWSQSSVLDTTIVAGGTRPKNCRPTAGRVEVCNASYGNNGWLGLAQIWASGSHITQGVAKMNDTYFNTPTYNSAAWRNLVMCQEVGHTLGLDHQDENFNNTPLGTCMDYSNDPVPNQHPNLHDYEQLGNIYSHINDSTTTVSQTSLAGKMPPAMRDIDFSGPAQWGKLIHSSHGGWKELYELDFGGGHKVFTFVIWATDEEEEGADRDRGRQ